MPGMLPVLQGCRAVLQKNKGVRNFCAKANYMTEDEELWQCPSESPLSSYLPDMAELDTEHDILTEEIENVLKEYPINYKEAAQRTVAVVERLRGDDFYDIQSYVSELLRKIIDARNSKMEAIALALIGGLDLVKETNITKVADICGVSKQALDARILRIIDGLKIKRGPHQRPQDKITYKVIKKGNKKPCDLNQWQ